MLSPVRRTLPVNNAQLCGDKCKIKTTEKTISLKVFDNKKDKVSLQIYDNFKPISVYVSKRKFQKKFSLTEKEIEDEGIDITRLIEPLIQNSIYNDFLDRVRNHLLIKDDMEIVNDIPHLDKEPGSYLFVYYKNLGKFIFLSRDRYGYYDRKALIIRKTIIELFSRKGVFDDTKTFMDLNELLNWVQVGSDLNQVRSDLNKGFSFEGIRSLPFFKQDLQEDNAQEYFDTSKPGSLLFGPGRSEGSFYIWVKDSKDTVYKHVLEATENGFIYDDAEVQSWYDFEELLVKLGIKGVCHCFDKFDEVLHRSFRAYNNLKSCNKQVPIFALKKDEDRGYKLLIVEDLENYWSGEVSFDLYNGFELSTNDINTDMTSKSISELLSSKGIDLLEAEKLVDSLPSIPPNYIVNCPQFCSTISREEANSLLEDKPATSFYIYPHETKRDYEISMKNSEGEIKNKSLKCILKKESLDSLIFSLANYYAKTNYEPLKEEVEIELKKIRNKLSEDDPTLYEIMNWGLDESYIAFKSSKKEKTKFVPFSFDSTYGFKLEGTKETYWAPSIEELLKKYCKSGCIGVAEAKNRIKMRKREHQTNKICS